MKEKRVACRESVCTIGVVGGTPNFDAALDRYVASCYFASTCVPAPDGNVLFEAAFWPNAPSPPAKVAVRIKLK